ncbi:PEP-CTERM sorting domain-containing protein [Actomonas aquatica]|uniref:PEP-CTERM sorting domain-containing protein n=1 Tax=Actomonas aquatica TaxID=2866162 RepID=A0ABZ1C5W4_9BACT|nr:PEP-CTERM sorting domain-containing protein [Opitutus sp. WL0086]WRQ85914.1 PEP-CTERM sorting domain-containing protein [Opitutus sp. WL0086]
MTTLRFALPRSLGVLAGVFACTLAPSLSAQWTNVVSAPSLNSWNGVTYGNGGFVAVNGFGRIATSTDGGLNFVETGDFSGSNVIFEDVAFGTLAQGNNIGSTGYVAIGASNSSAAAIYESLDGQTWTNVTSDYGSYFAGQTGKTVSIDGSSNLRAVVNNLSMTPSFFDGTTHYAFRRFQFDNTDVYTSTNGTTFTQSINDYAFEAIGGLYTGSDYLLVGTDRDGSRYAATVLTSDLNDAPVITVIEGATGYLSSVIDTGYGYVAVGGSDNFTDMNAFSSVDGTTWLRDTVTTTNNAPYDLSDIAMGDGRLVAVGAYGIITREVSLSAVPEPSTYAALTGLIVLGWVMRRRLA